MPKSSEGSGKLDPEHEAVIPNAQWYPTIGDYGHYRLGLMMARQPDAENKHVNGPIGNHPMTIAYTNADLDIVNRARKLCGYPLATLTAGGSQEPDNIHKVSPINTTKHRHPRRPWERKD